MGQASSGLDDTGTEMLTWAYVTASGVRLAVDGPS